MAKTPISRPHTASELAARATKAAQTHTKEHRAIHEAQNVEAAKSFDQHQSNHVWGKKVR